MIHVDVNLNKDHLGLLFDLELFISEASLALSLTPSLILSFLKVLSHKKMDFWGHLGIKK